MTADQTSQRVLIATFGSAGDLFPYIAVGQALRSGGVDVRLASSRTLGIYGRLARVPSVGLGDGSEISVLADRRLATSRFNGWDSWHQTLERYVAPQLAASVTTLMSLFARWRPDVVIAGSFAAAARIASAAASIPTVEITIYPQHVRLGFPGVATKFARSMRQSVSRVASEHEVGLDPSALVWGRPEHALALHDPGLLDPQGIRPIGFPLWQGGFSDTDDATIEAWRSVDSRQCVLVTLGSFLGQVRPELVDCFARHVNRTGARTIILGSSASSTLDQLHLPLVDLPSILPAVDAVVHHGGIGTSYTVLAAGKPAVIVPIAFDQATNGGLFEQAGAAVLAEKPADVAAGIERALADEALRTSAAAWPPRLRPTEQVFADVTAAVMTSDRVSRGRHG